ncbi:hypothetical protein Prudu_36S000200, partial [Prunus dulcis]
MPKGNHLNSYLRTQQTIGGSGLRWEGSAHDSQVLKDALSRKNGLKVPNVDVGYTNGIRFLAPFRGQRYHLNDWRDGHRPETPNEFLNMKHSSARNVIETEMALDPIEHQVDNQLVDGTLETNDYIGTVESSDEWSVWRQNLANEMLFIVMSSTATSSEKVKGGRGQNKRDWTTNEDNTLMECLMELHQNTNWRGDSGFKNGYLNILETMLEVKLPNSGLRASPHIESKVKTLKGKYGALDDALSQSGFGTKKMQVVSTLPGLPSRHLLPSHGRRSQHHLLREGSSKTTKRPSPPEVLSMKLLAYQLGSKQAARPPSPPLKTSYF